MKNKFFSLFIFAYISSCSLSPGMHMPTNTSWISKNAYVYINSLDKELPVENINSSLVMDHNNKPYKIGIGDQIAITVWGIPDVFPIVNINPDQNLRRVDNNGNIFFPYIGVIKAHNKTQDQLRNEITEKLSVYFNEPQLDISIARFNSKKVFVLGEVTTPKKININDIPLSLSDVIGIANGLNTNTSSGSDVFVIRSVGGERIFRADLSSPAGFLSANNFYLQDNDIVYVNSKGTTRWNRVISQFFPFSSFLNSVDNLIED